MHWQSLQLSCKWVSLDAAQACCPAWCNHPIRGQCRQAFLAFASSCFGNCAGPSADRQSPASMSGRSTRSSKLRPASKRPLRLRRQTTFTVCSFHLAATCPASTTPCHATSGMQVAKETGGCSHLPCQHPSLSSVLTGLGFGAPHVVRWMQTVRRAPKGRVGGARSHSIREEGMISLRPAARLPRGSHLAAAMSSRLRTGQAALLAKLPGSGTTR